MIYNNSRGLHITNGAIGYRWSNDGQYLNMIGQYNSEWIETSYKRYWELKTSSEETPTVVGAYDGTANLDQVYGSFFENDVQTMALTADLGDGQTAFLSSPLIRNRKRRKTMKSGRRMNRKTKSNTKTNPNPQLMLQ